MSYQLTTGWPVNIETGDFVNPETNHEYLEWLASGQIPEPASTSAAPLPNSVTMRQARLALLAVGKLAAVSIAIASLPSPQKDAAQIEWEYAATVDRGSALTALLGAALGFDDVDLDALFVQAAAI